MSQGNELSDLAEKSCILEEAFIEASNGALRRELITGYDLGPEDPCPECEKLNFFCEEPCESCQSFMVELDSELKT